MMRSLSRLLPALLLGAGALCAGSLAALAGDKIAFSWSSEKTLTMPAVAHPDDAEDLSFGHSSVEPVTDMDYVIPETATVNVVPFNRGKRQDAGNGKSTSLFGNRRQDGSLESADERGQDDSDDPDSATNQYKSSYSMEKGWDADSSQRLEDLGLGYGTAGSRQDPSDIYLRRDRQNDPQSGRNSGKDWPGQTDGASSKGFGSQKQSVTDILRQQSRYNSQLDLFKQSQSQGLDSPETYGQPATSSLQSIAPRDADKYEDNLFSPGNPFSIQENSSRQGQGVQDALPDVRAWETPASRDPVPQQVYKPVYVPPSQGQPPVDSHPARLALPKIPGAINN